MFVKGRGMGTGPPRHQVEMGVRGRGLGVSYMYRLAVIKTDTCGKKAV